jgi:hypothetical protein
MRRLVRTSVVLVGALLLPAANASAHIKGSTPAGGGELGEVVGGTVVSTLLMVGMVWLSVRYRRGGAAHLRRLGAFAE